MHRFAEARVETFTRVPTELAADFAGVDRVAPIVAWSILNEGDLLCVRLAVTAGALLIEDSANQIHNLNIRFLARPTNIVRFANSAA
jgi:hypothetical protein